MTYWNPIDRYGVERFAADLASAGGAGLITPDLIPDEAGPWIAASDATTSSGSSSWRRPRRTPAAQHAEACRGWVYAASTMGVTGVRSQVGDHAAGLVARTRAAGADRVCVGLGVSTGDQAATVAGYADGVIVGSAFVRALGEGGAAGVEQLARELAAGVRRGRAGDGRS
jgi:tryptophan synthase alpha chain